MGVLLVNRVGLEIGGHDASRLLSWPWMDFDTLNCPCAPKKLILAPDDENSDLPFSNPGNITDGFSNLWAGHSE
jgi:hypothetical protein